MRPGGAEARGRGGVGAAQRPWPWPWPSRPSLLAAGWAAELEAQAERVEQVSSLLARLPGPVLVVLRYLFTFLNQ